MDWKRLRRDARHSTVSIAMNKPARGAAIWLARSISLAKTDKGACMYITMNRFKVRLEEQEAFKARWLDREVYLNTAPGFVAFHLLQGPAREDHVLYASHTVWSSHDAFDGWTRSEQFRAAHAGAGSGRSLTLTHPEFEGFEVLQEITSEQNDTWSKP